MLMFGALPALAQFNASIQGSVVDASGASVSGAHLRLTNQSTGHVLSVDADSTGVYRFVNLAPSQYSLEVQAKGFAKTAVNLTLVTNQNLEVPVKLAIASENQTVTVTTQPPVLDTAEIRNELTLENQAVDSLPLVNRTLAYLVTMAPGVTGTGIMGGGSPGSGNDNYSTETQLDASANGQGSVANMFIVDGLDVTSAIRPGVLNLMPNPDSVQETAIQVNTYGVEYGRASSVQMAMTTKSGGEKFHGSISDYFNNQMLWTRKWYMHGANYAPFHTNNMSGAVGGPVWPLKQTFFFFAIEPLREITSTGGGTIQFEAPEFTNWAKTAYPNSIGTGLFNSYPVSKVVNQSVLLTAAQYFNDGACGTAVHGNIPCNLPVIEQGTFNSTSFRNGMQYFARLDKNFANDRLYGSFYRTTLNTGGAAPRAAFATTQNYWAVAWQGNEEHTFSPTTINEAIAGGMRVEGVLPATGNFKVPVVNVWNLGTGFGNGFAMGDFIQHNYHWRDVLTHIHGAHTFKIGYEGWFGDDVELFQGPYDMPTFWFNDIVQLVQDSPANESGVAYNPVTGKHVEWDWNAASATHGIFVQDNWKARKNLTVNVGVRWDDFGNPWSRSAGTVFGNFYKGPGATANQQIANGFVLQKTHALNRTITDVISPRGGVAWDITGNGQWVIHGGAGIFHNWPTMANVQEEFRGNPPGAIFPTFIAGTKHSPVWGLGNSNKPPFGYTYPTLDPTPLNAQGGLTGLQFGIGGIDPNLKSPVTYNYSAQLAHPLTRSFVATVGYTGSRSHNQMSGGGQVANVSYGVDINSYPGDLIQNFPTNLVASTQTLLQTRLNQSFGSIYYTQNDRRSDYNAFIADVRGRFAGSGFVDASYTRSVSKDNTQVYPTWINPGQFYGLSNWDTPNRISVTGNYEVHGLKQAKKFLNEVTGGWGISGTLIFQSGNPFTVTNWDRFIPLCDGATSVATSNCTSSSKLTGNAGGDYNADGNNQDFPNVATYSIAHSRKDFQKGVFGSTATDRAKYFSTPAFGAGEGNEIFNNFRGPSFFQTSLGLAKETTIRESVKFEFRCDIFNVFQNVNINNPDTSMTSGTLGVSTSLRGDPRWIQFGGSLKF